MSSWWGFRRESTDEITDLAVRRASVGTGDGRLTLQWLLEVAATPTLFLVAKRRRDSGLEVFYESQILMNRSFCITFHHDRLYF